ncbi:MAG: hypothetical protein ACON5P_02580, partial [Candidatus Puniceispirillaceae bacterium]
MGEGMIIINDTGFHRDSWHDYARVTVVTLPEIAEKQGLSDVVLRLENDQPIDGALGYLGVLENIAIAFPSSAD